MISSLSYLLTILLISSMSVSCSNISVSKDLKQNQAHAEANQIFEPPIPPSINMMRVEDFSNSGINGVPIWFSMIHNRNIQNNLAGSRECLSLLPDGYKNGVIDMTSDKGNPDPLTWYLTIKPKENAFGLRYLEVYQGRIVKNTGISIFANIFWSHQPMLLNNIVIDSRAAYTIAIKEAASRGKTISYAIFQLKNKKNLEPTWTIWCYGLNDAYLGLFDIRAHDGAITSIKGF
jgi:hypothetical protein